MRVPRAPVVALAVAVAGCAGPSGTGGGPARPTGGTARPPAASPTSGAPAASPPATTAPRVSPRDWITYHHDAARTGVTTGSPPAGPLSVAWRAKLDGAVYGQPLAVGGVVIAATEGDSVYGLDRSTGRVRWRVHVGTPVPLSALPCGNIDPLGITGTPVYDPATGLVYAVAETTGFRHVLVGVSVAAGKVRVRRDIPAPDGHPRYDQQRAALALAGGRVYVAFGGLAGDCGPYRGSVVGVPASGRGPLVSYLVPTAREGGIWAPAGPVVSPGGTIYVGVGNGAATGGAYDGSDSVTALSPRLRRIGIFAPATWADDNAHDLDLGSMSPALLPDGRLLAVGKRGTGYLLNGSRLGGVAGQVAQRRVCRAFGGSAVGIRAVYVPCEGGGMAAVSVRGSAIRVRWRGPAGAAGSPVAGGGAVWVADWGNGTVYQLSPAHGRVAHRISLGSPLPHFVSPSLSGRLVLIGTLDGVVAVRGA